MVPQNSEQPRCFLCSRAAITNESYCIMHAAALSKVRERFPDWQRAMGDISWERYLERIIRLKETGDSSREVARHLLSQVTSNRGNSVGSR
jgi:hypothetical protein